MYLPDSVNSLASTSTLVWYLYATLTGNQPASQWTTKTGVFSDVKCRSLCSSSLTCSQYFYTDSSGSVCLVSNNSSEFSLTGPSVGEFSFAIKLSLNLVTFANYNYDTILSNAGLKETSNFHTCYSIVDNFGVENFTTCGISKTANLERASDGTLCLNAANTFSCDFKYASVSCLSGSGLSFTATGSAECVMCDILLSPGGISSCDKSTTGTLTAVVEVNRATKGKNSVTWPGCASGQGVSGPLTCTVCPSNSVPATPFSPCPCPANNDCTYVPGSIPQSALTATCKVGYLIPENSPTTQLCTTCGFGTTYQTLSYGLPPYCKACNTLIDNAVNCDPITGELKQW